MVLLSWQPKASLTCDCHAGISEQHYTTRARELTTALAYECLSGRKLSSALVRRPKAKLRCVLSVRNAVFFVDLSSGINSGQLDSVYPTVVLG